MLPTYKPKKKKTIARLMSLELDTRRIAKDLLSQGDVKARQLGSYLNNNADWIQRETEKIGSVDDKS